MGDPSQQVRYLYIDGSPTACRYFQVSTDTCRYLQIYLIRQLPTYFRHVVQATYIHSALLISPPSESTVRSWTVSASFPFFKQWHLSLNTWIISPSGISPGILLHACRTVEARVDLSDSPCRSLLTVSPPCENLRSTSHEDAKEQCHQSITKSVLLAWMAYQEQIENQWPYAWVSLTLRLHATIPRGWDLLWRWSVCSNILQVHRWLCQCQSCPMYRTNHREKDPDIGFR